MIGKRVRFIQDHFKPRLEGLILDKVLLPHREFRYSEGAANQRGFNFYDAENILTVLPVHFYLIQGEGMIHKVRPEMILEVYD